MLCNFLTKNQTLQKIYAQGKNKAHSNVCVLICRHILRFPKSNDRTHPF